MTAVAPMVPSRLVMVSMTSPVEPASMIFYSLVLGGALVVGIGFAFLLMPDRVDRVVREALEHMWGDRGGPLPVRGGRVLGVLFVVIGIALVVTGLVIRWV